MPAITPTTAVPNTAANLKAYVQLWWGRFLIIEFAELVPNPLVSSMYIPTTPMPHRCPHLHRDGA